MRHAYLIMCHNKMAALRELLHALDFPQNDIVLHLDSRWDIDLRGIERQVMRANISFTKKRLRVNWGGCSQIAATLLLLEAAREVGHHSYYHMLTGVCMPLQPVEKINAFFDNIAVDRLLINYSDKAECLRQFELRAKYPQFFRDKCGRRKNAFAILNKLGYCVAKTLDSGQGFIADEFYCGSAYWDITEDLVDALILNREEFLRRYRYTSCCDEAFVQSFVWGSQFKARLFVPELGNGMRGNMRWIDFDHGSQGSPATITGDNIEEAIRSGMLFARKFDIDRFPEAYSKLHQLIDCR